MSATAKPPSASSGDFADFALLSLAAALKLSADAATEAAQALLRCGAEEDPAIKETVARSHHVAQLIDS